MLVLFCLVLGSTWSASLFSQRKNAENLSVKSSDCCLLTLICVNLGKLFQYAVFSHSFRCPRLCGRWCCFSLLRIFRHGEYHLKVFMLLRLFLIGLLFLFLFLLVLQITRSEGAYRTKNPAMITSFIAAIFSFPCTGSLVVYRTLFYRLNGVPGPLLARVTKLWHLGKILNTSNHLLLDELHKQYGDFVRTGKYLASFRSIGLEDGM